MVKNKIHLMLGTIFLLLSTFSYAASITVTKPEIDKISYFTGKWHINYTDVKSDSRLKTEELFVDGKLDRVVNAGTITAPYKRGFSLHGTYDSTTCHKGYLVVYDNAHKQVTKSDDFMFGDTTKCNLPPMGIVKPVINNINYSSGKWRIGYKDMAINKNLGYEELYVNGILDRKITAGVNAVNYLRGFPLHGAYSSNQCNKAYIVLYDTSGNELTRSDTFNFGDTTNCSVGTGQIVIKQVKFFGHKWHIQYKDVKSALNLSREDLYVDGILDRTVNAGTTNSSLERGYSLFKTYDKNSCHKAVISLYDNNNNLVTKSETFNFGNLSKCGMQGDTVKPIITLVGGEVPLNVGDTYTDAGATASDNVDGDITADINVTSNVDTSVAGTYAVAYNVEDAAGNKANEVVRKVVVKDNYVPVPTHEVVLCQNKSAYINKLYTLGMTINSNVATGSVLSKGNDFVGAVLCAKYSTETSSSAVLNKIKNSAFPSAITVISSNNADGSIKAQYEVSAANTQAFAQLKAILQATGETDFSNYVDYSTFDSIQNFLIDIFVHYVDSTTTYIIVTVTDKNENNVEKLNTLVTQGTIKNSNSQSQETDVFNYGGSSLKADILFVMDDSGSMSQEQSTASQAITRTFGNAMSAKGIDWKATVIGTEEGRDYSNKHISNPSLNDITKLSNQLLLGTRGGDEVGLKLAYQYLKNGDITVRNDSKLSIVYVSDETAHTMLSELDVTDINDSYFVQNKIKFNVIIPLYLSTNANLAYQVANLTGAEVANIYNYATGYDAMMQKIADDAAGSASQIILTRTPILASIQVSVNGTILGAGWTYNPSNNSIVFDVASAPNAGDSVSVTYNY